MNRIEEQAKHFESISSRYYESRQGRNHLLLKNLLWNYFFEGKSHLRKENLLVLEPMCGYAEGKGILERGLGIDVLYEGFDYSDAMLDAARKLHPGIEVAKVDITSFEPNKLYDLIILIGGLHHVPDFVGVALKTMFRSIREGGCMISFEPTQNNTLFSLARQSIYRKNGLFDSRTERAFDLTDLNRFYQEAGFRIEDQIYPGLLSYILYYNPDAFPFLNFGTQRVVKSLFSLDSLFFRSLVGRKLSFATLTLLRK
jgi:SAM-dependent methyltransferase